MRKSLIYLLFYFHHRFRSKTKGDAGDSKYLLLDTVTGVDPTAPPKGEFKGIVKRVRVSGPNLLITIESGDFLELKVSMAYLCAALLCLWLMSLRRCLFVSRSNLMLLFCCC